MQTNRFSPGSAMAREVARLPGARGRVAAEWGGVLLCVPVFAGLTFIHNRSGAGSDLLAVDLNGDGAIDIVTSTSRGTFIFWGKPHAGKTPAAGRK